jgi:hypothetical protein
VREVTARTGPRGYVGEHVHHLPTCITPIKERNEVGHSSSGVSFRTYGIEGEGLINSTPLDGYALAGSDWDLRLIDLFFRSLGELAVVEIGVEAVLCEQSFVGALFDDAAVVHDQDQVGVSDG